MGWWSVLTSWWGGISLRVKLILSLIASALSVFSYLYVRWRAAAAMGARASEKADRLSEARAAEIAILKRREAARERHEALRQEIRQRTERDFFQ
jgi:hypothetical protein